MSFPMEERNIKKRGAEQWATSMAEAVIKYYVREGMNGDKEVFEATDAVKLIIIKNKIKII